MSTIRFKTFSGSFSRYWNENLKIVFLIFFGQNMLKNEISINKFCPQSGLKHSVVKTFVEKRFGLYRSTNMLRDTIDGKVTTVFFL